jgi:hypothetical protein
MPAACFSSRPGRLAPGPRLVFVLAAALGLLLAPPGPAPAADSAALALERVHGVWKADIDATLVRMAARRTQPMLDYELEDLKASLGQLELTVDAGSMLFTEKGPDGSGGSFTIQSMELDGDTLRIHGDHRRYSITLQDDGSIVVGAGVVMRKAE